MKTAISINDLVYKNAEEAASRMKMSRSRFYSMAIEEYIKSHQDDMITERLNEYYGNHKSELDEDLKHAARRVLGGEDW